MARKSMALAVPHVGRLAWLYSLERLGEGGAALVDEGVRMA
jgi:hypothetical protein